ncbi:MAG: LLM class flavin-dependent oxidoreductase [Actinomycetota bacterium]
MKITISGKDIRVFTISPRTAGLDSYRCHLEQTIRLSEEYACTGILIYTGNDTYLEPWCVAQMMMERTSSLSPLVAVNPVYLHPFTAARLSASFAYLYRRPVFLNMVTGAAISQLEALGDSCSHDDRYERMREYLLIMKGLVGSSRPFSFEGRFYRVKNLQLPVDVSPELQPCFVLAGQSSAARRICNMSGAVGMHMLHSGLEHAIAESRGIHFGIVTRPTSNDAWKAARALFPPDEDGREIVDLSMGNTDSVWKFRMRFEAEQPDISESGYWLEPFRNARADCPYFVHCYERTASLIAGLIRGGVDMFILDIPASDEEYHHVAKAFSLARHSLCSATDLTPRAVPFAP